MFVVNANHHPRYSVHNQITKLNTINLGFSLIRTTGKSVNVTILRYRQIKIKTDKYRQIHKTPVNH